MKELVEVIAKALVDHPEEVSVNEKKEGRTTVLEAGTYSQSAPFRSKGCRSQREQESRCRYCIR